MKKWLIAIMNTLYEYKKEESTDESEGMTSLRSDFQRLSRGQALWRRSMGEKTFFSLGKKDAYFIKS